MKIKVSPLVNILLGVALVVSIAANLTGAVDYDPWLDVTDDGYGGIDDIVSTAEHFGASGDPIKLCNITNWPIWMHAYTEQTLVMDEILYEDSPLLSGLFPAHGFGKLHVLAHSGYLGVGESLEINIYGLILDSSQTVKYQIPVYTFVFNSSLNYMYVTIPVPSESFRFSANVNSTTGCELSLSFYLTWG